MLLILKNWNLITRLHTELLEIVEVQNAPVRREKPRVLYRNKPINNGRVVLENIIYEVPTEKPIRVFPNRRLIM